MTGGWLSVVRGGIAALGSCAAVGAARAETILGAPVSGQMGFLPANTVVQADIEWFHNDILLPVTIGISLLVLVLLAYVVYRFNEQANPVASRTAHNGPLEIAWTVVPALVLVVIAVPSFRLLSQQLIIPAPDMTLKVTASQWHWNYGYPKSDGGFSFDSLIKEDKDLKPGDIRLLSVDNAAYVPVGKIVEVDVVSQDVIHSFSVPSFGIKIDAVPGASTRPGSRPTTKASFTDNAPISAASTTPSCRSRFMSSVRTPIKHGLRAPRSSSPTPTASTSRRRLLSDPDGASSSN